MLPLIIIVTYYSCDKKYYSTLPFFMYILCYNRCVSDSFPLPSIPLLGHKEPLPGLPELDDAPPTPPPPRSRGQFNKRTGSHRAGGSYQAKVRSCRLPGQRPQRTPMLKLPYNLGEYPVPDELREAVEGGDEREVMVMKPCLEEVTELS